DPNRVSDEAGRLALVAEKKRTRIRRIFTDLSLPVGIHLIRVHPCPISGSLEPPGSCPAVRYPRRHDNRARIASNPPETPAMRCGTKRSRIAVSLRRSCRRSFFQMLREEVHSLLQGLTQFRAPPAVAFALHHHHAGRGPHFL